MSEEKKLLLPSVEWARDCTEKIVKKAMSTKEKDIEIVIGSSVLTMYSMLILTIEKLNGIEE